MADIGDIIEMIVDIPEENIFSGKQGAIVHQHDPETFEIEFVRTDGSTESVAALKSEQFIVVWEAETEQPVPLADQISALVARLPEDAATEVLDFARFLSAKKHPDRLATPA